MGVTEGDWKMDLPMGLRVKDLVDRHQVGRGA
jgi:hypothetical protein